MAVSKCPHCGHDSFIQKFVVKTGVKVVDGVAKFNKALVTGKALVFICENCHSYVPGTIINCKVPFESKESLN